MTVKSMSWGAITLLTNRCCCWALVPVQQQSLVEEVEISMLFVSSCFYRTPGFSCKLWHTYTNTWKQGKPELFYIHHKQELSGPSYGFMNEPQRGKLWVYIQTTYAIHGGKQTGPNRGLGAMQLHDDFIFEKQTCGSLLMEKLKPC